MINTILAQGSNNSKRVNLCKVCGADIDNWRETMHEEHKCEVSHLTNVLTKSQQDAGFTVKEDDHVVYLHCYGKLIHQYLAQNLTVAQLRHDADQHIESQKNGVSFGKVN